MVVGVRYPSRYQAVAFATLRVFELGNLRFLKAELPLEVCLRVCTYFRFVYSSDCCNTCRDVRQPCVGTAMPEKERAILWFGRVKPLVTGADVMYIIDSHCSTQLLLLLAIVGALY